MRCGLRSTIDSENHDATTHGITYYDAILTPITSTMLSSNLTVTDAIESVEEAFAALAKGKVDVPMPMHIGIEESAVAGPGDCHIKGGYVSATPTFTVKLACVSFYKNLEAGLPPGSGIFIVVNAVSKFTSICECLHLRDYLVPHRTVTVAHMCIVQRK